MMFLVVLGLVVGILGYEAIMLVRVSFLRKSNPSSTSLIDTRVREAEAKGQQPRREQVWVPLEKISTNLQRAVLAGEDTNFTTHRGFDYEAIQKAFEQAQRETARQAKAEGEDDDWLPSLPEFKRGGSTISQQLAKNLYLSSQRSFLRKGQEAALTVMLERTLTKRRILEIYLNVIEWGDGIYGAEAASQRYFRKSASSADRQRSRIPVRHDPQPTHRLQPTNKPSPRRASPTNHPPRHALRKAALNRPEIHSDAANFSRLQYSKAASRL